MADSKNQTDQPEKDTSGDTANAGDAQQGTIADADTSQTDDAIRHTAEEHRDDPQTVAEKGKGKSAAM